jgi:predicted dehydrogenase
MQKNVMMVCMRKLRTAVIGVGYLGKFHVQKYAALNSSQLVAVCDTHKENVSALAQQWGVSACTDYRNLAGLVDAVSIVTPTPSHHEIARFFLEKGIHVLLEKPIGQSLQEAEDLINIARAQKVVLQIGHIERFNNVFQGAIPLLKNPRFIEAWRLAPFKLRGSDVSVVLDMMIHDLDIIHHIVQSPVKSIQAVGACVYSPFLDIANARIEFNNGCVANINASRIHPRVSRRLYILQSDGILNCDLHYKKIKFQQIPLNHTQKISFPKDDPLREEIDCFLTSILENKPPKVSGEDGKIALATALQIDQTIVNNLSSAAIYA